MMLAVLTVLLGASACALQFKNGIQGSAVQQTIDETITPMLRSYDESLRIEPAKCEPIIVQRSGTMGSCDLRVNGVPLKIRVTGAGSPGHFKVDFGDAVFFEMSQVEKLAENMLAQNVNIRVVVGCGDPRVRLLKPGSYLICSVSGSPAAKSIKLKAMTNGIFVYNPPGLKGSSPIPQSLLTHHKQGKTAIARGGDIETFISRGIRANPESRDHNAVVRCPSLLDLTGNRRGECVVLIPGQTLRQRMSVWIEDANGIRTIPIDAVIDQQRVQQLAQSDLNRRLQDNGDTSDATVACAKGLLVIQWPGTFDCKATAGGKRYRLIVSVQDSRGTVSWRAVNLNHETTSNGRPIRQRHP